ncbi:hypothetical protein, conserved [Babesia ovata]|uniref:Uncharacterized protein n=1 Tax=Babesia ovata TaxID=189622 RepID=A0A2H6KGC5_9APIC|nr:uncharacterized protein BOVATA_035270 [Babesia ovata]GBE62034.1 hypothetical protein, conserved [Babesia ovata]
MVRQPKKLTDCPENLRESIDWLIQVKHGNGTNGKDGLTSLAEALKKLIGDAIKKANESLKNREDELKCADKYDNEHHNKHCKSLKDQIATANEPEKSKKKSVLKKHYDEVHYLTEDARNRALGDITERQNKLKELTKNLEAFIGQENDGNDNPATKLLENLTEGLEKFLGYQETSKGYDGTGIVYSDLDRLCDGVMAFLHGVLSGVKGEENVIGFPHPFCIFIAKPRAHQILQCQHDIFIACTAFQHTSELLKFSFNCVIGVSNCFRLCTKGSFLQLTNHLLNLLKIVAISILSVTNLFPQPPQMVHDVKWIELMIYFDFDSCKLPYNGFYGIIDILRFLR